jgi:arylsulfatase
VAAAKYAGCAIQNSRFTLVNNGELYDLKADPGERNDVIDEYPELVAKLRAAYDEWWAAVQPLLGNEKVVGPRMNPMKELYWKQFGGGPDAAPLERMDPNTTAGGDDEREAPQQKKRKAARQSADGKR